MKTRPCKCRYCSSPAAVEEAPERQEIALPQQPTPIRVHKEGLPPFDCTLHPDGTLTAVIGGEVRRNWLSFIDMCERNWAGAHIEVDPPPLVEGPAAGPVVEAVQDAIPLTAA